MIPTGITPFCVDIRVTMSKVMVSPVDHADPPVVTVRLLKAALDAADPPAAADNVSVREPDTGLILLFAAVRPVKRRPGLAKTVLSDPSLLAYASIDHRLLAPMLGPPGHETLPIKVVPLFTLAFIVSELFHLPDIPAHDRSGVSGLVGVAELSSPAIGSM
jgi:hypothetical protein